MVYGVKNVRLASYRIWNVSDDKPKFVVRNTYKVRPGDQESSASLRVFLDIPNVEFSESDELAPVRVGIARSQ